ncbi:leucyl/phenylalanyl-tRNA--protein transferase [Saccharospirillum sp. MSK14-1]|uniref:leucyl/phenylalanyl-tRNA--protein transferase n=1 Tax=Saccharospirillum sp. MSK14-1 TaxID=1897632 RepID=UPI000D367D1D|nr:leucyl/phenylalanyl-tRNA--protein transferase [Saccharospirillum sp. MSK14-1]PTY36563.1 leucyl/phenylalanyl-tRNA--protein transferase [Saccharospirillum sp. MSK14-1]
MPQIAWLNAEQPPDFPPTETALSSPSGILAAGGSLRPDWLLTAYQRGIFPWFNEGEPILWWSPSPRMVLLPGTMQPSRSLRKAFRRAPIQLAVNRNFAGVIQACRAPRPEQAGTWITDDIVDAYCELHRLGWAHSIEVYQDEELIGGLYGLGIEKVFFGESMFSRQPNASKYAFLALSDWAKESELRLIDCQVYNDHLASLGAVEIDRPLFEATLPQQLTPITTLSSARLNDLLIQRLAHSTNRQDTP